MTVALCQADGIPKRMNGTLVEEDDTGESQIQGTEGET